MAGGLRWFGLGSRFPGCAAARRRPIEVFLVGLPLELLGARVVERLHDECVGVDCVAWVAGDPPGKFVAKIHEIAYPSSGPRHAEGGAGRSWSRSAESLPSSSASSTSGSAALAPLCGWGLA